MTGYMASFEPAMREALAEARAAATLDATPATGSGAGRGIDDTAALPSVTEGGAELIADVPVGAVVLDAGGAVIGRGRNRREVAADPTGHAEIVALRSAGRAVGSWRLDGCTLVVTLEPCTMCAGALLVSRVARLVYGVPDARAGAAGSVWDVLHDPRLGPPVEVIGGVLAADCAALLREFFDHRR